MMTAYLFDVDGVLTDPVYKRTEPALLDQLIQILSRGDPVAFNTGRGLEWVEKQILADLLQKLTDKTLLQRLILIGEKGETWLFFDAEGKVHKRTTEGLAMPEALQQQFKHILETKYHDAMFFDETKTVMVTAEMHDGYDLDRFQGKKHRFIEEVKQLLQACDPEKKYKLHFDEISVSIEHKHVGKALGAQRFLTFLAELQMTPDTYYCFGDTESDFDMADYLAAKGKKVYFVYTGKKNNIEINEKSYPIIFETGYSLGTLAYLERMN
ncbi:MAG TPA: hypothetical protein VLF20_01790 [Patescibacteria group bacterium]|nr:hypothetical protein [Patescibacteria group bacterium]